MALIRVSPRHLGLIRTARFSLTTDSRAVASQSHDSDQRPGKLMKHLISADGLYLSSAEFQAKLEEQEQ